MAHIACSAWLRGIDGDLSEGWARQMWARERKDAGEYNLVMNRLDIEEWAYCVVNFAESAQAIEDDRVELKSHFPEAREIAGQLGGHANVARGEEILWLFGVDEKRGVVDVEMRDMAIWRSQLEAEFEGGAPIAQQLTLESK